MANEPPHNDDRNAALNRPMFVGGFIPVHFGRNFQPSDLAIDYAVREELF